VLVPRLRGGPLAICLALFLIATGLLPASAAVTYDQAWTAYKAGDYRGAIKLLDSFIAANPRDSRALVLRGDAKAEVGDDEAALKDYNTAIEIAPDYEYAYVTRCETRLQLNDQTGAMSDCDMAIRLDPTDAKAYEDRGDVDWDRENYRMAQSDYSRAIELGRSNAYLFAARCDADRLVDDRDRAASDCEKSLTLDPKNRRGLWARGRLELTGAQYTKAIADLNSFILQKPDSSDAAYYYRGLAYNRIGSFKLALTDLQTYVGRKSDDPDGYQERAIARYGLGDKDGALADLDKAQAGYRKDADTVAADRVAAMIVAVRAGKQLTPP